MKKKWVLKRSVARCEMVATSSLLPLGTHMRRDVGSDLSQDVLPVQQLDSDGHQNGVWEETELSQCHSFTFLDFHIKASTFTERFLVNFLLPLTSISVLDEALQDEDEMEVVLSVTQRQHSNASHGWILFLWRQYWTECLCM